MTDKKSVEIQVKPKQEIASPAEQTRPGLVFTPGVDIFETESDITLLADLPGVAADNLVIDLRENILTLSGEVEPVEGANEEEILKEYDTGRYLRHFSLSNVIDQSRIDAHLADGVLRLRLPKVETVKPRKIDVKTGT